MTGGQLGIEVVPDKVGWMIRLTPVRDPDYESIVAIFRDKADAERYAEGCKARLNELFTMNKRLWDTPPRYRERPSKDYERLRDQIERSVFGKISH